MPEPVAYNVPKDSRFLTEVRFIDMDCFWMSEPGNILKLSSLVL
jgi:hypothetical protein